MVTLVREPAYEPFPNPEAYDCEIATDVPIPNMPDIGTTHRLIPREKVRSACRRFMIETTATLDTLGLLPTENSIGNNYFEGLRDGEYLFQQTEETDLAETLMDIAAGAAASKAERPSSADQLRTITEGAMNLLFQVKDLSPREVVKQELANHCEDLSRTETNIYKDREGTMNKTRIRSEEARNKFISWVENSRGRAYYLQCVAYELRK